MLERSILAAPILLLTWLIGCGWNTPEPATGPNVLLLSVDTLRPDYLGVGGYDRPTSPVIDGLIRKGTWFPRAVAPVPRTTPALASLLTGLHPHHHGVRRLHDTRARGASTLAEVAKANGYQTVAVVSNHIVDPKRGLNAGFDTYDMKGDARIAAQTTADALRHYKATKPGQAVFLWVHYIDPHVPYRPPAKYAQQFDPTYKGRFKMGFGGKPGSLGKAAYPRPPGKKKVVFDNPFPDTVNAHVRRLYAADIRQTDDAVHTLLDALKADRGNDWVVVFTSDHGESLGENNYFYDHGDYAYEAAARVPLAFIDLRNPRSEMQTVTTWTSLIDVAPTLADWLGWAWPRQTDGRSLVPALNGQPLEERPVFVESGKNFMEGSVPRRVTLDVKGRFRSATLGRHKLIYTPGHEAPWELYDLQTDPWETTNLWATHGHSDEAKQLVSALQAWMDEDKMAEPPATPSAEDVEVLKALGYMEDG